MSDLPQTRSEQPLAWRIAQIAVWAVGLGILLLLLLRPEIGLHAFWNVLIPVAPLVLVLMPGVWRNVCPLASTALFPRHQGRSRRVQMSAATQSWLQLLGVILLLLIVPLRHVSFDLDARTTFTLLAVAGFAAASLGSIFDWKSAWCAGACPVHPVERLYGSSPAILPSNAHCTECVQCSTPCPDSTGGKLDVDNRSRPLRSWTAILMAGVFPGFVWGWFQVPDYLPGEGLGHLGLAYGLPLGAGLATLVLYCLARRLGSDSDRLTRIFAAAAVACYYWYRIPALGGFGPHPGDGMLVDLRGVVPEWAPTLSRALSTALLGAWLVFGLGRHRIWQVRPPLAAATRQTD